MSGSTRVHGNRKAHELVGTVIYSMDEETQGMLRRLV